MEVQNQVQDRKLKITTEQPLDKIFSKVCATYCDESLYRFCVFIPDHVLQYPTLTTHPASNPRQDPSPGIRKQLKVEYVTRGFTGAVRVREINDALVSNVELGYPPVPLEDS